MPKPNKRRRHLIQRVKERIDSTIPIRELEQDLKPETIMFAKKLTNSRSLGYKIINNIPIKLIYSKTAKKLITVLKIEHEFEFPKNDFIEYQNGLNKYRIRIFPDAYLETENSRALTIFEIFENEEWREKKKTGPIFEKIFQIVWGKYEEAKKTQINISVG